MTKVTGRTVADYLEEKLFRPLGITRYHWDESTDGYSAGGWGLYLTTESMAKMGQFYLQKGVWNGVRLLDEAWFDEATKPQIYQYDRSNPEAVAAAEGDDWKQGYGYQLWVCTHDSYRMDDEKMETITSGYFQKAQCFRIRTQKDESGSVTNCFYGKIYGEFEWFPDYYHTPHIKEVKFTYYINETPMDRNLEADRSDLKGGYFRP